MGKHEKTWENVWKCRVWRETSGPHGRARLAVPGQLFSRSRVETGDPTPTVHSQSHGVTPSCQARGLKSILRVPSLAADLSYKFFLFYFVAFRNESVAKPSRIALFSTTFLLLTFYSCTYLMIISNCSPLLQLLPLLIFSGLLWISLRRHCATDPLFQLFTVIRSPGISQD